MPKPRRITDPHTGLRYCRVCYKRHEPNHYRFEPCLYRNPMTVRAEVATEQRLLTKFPWLFVEADV